MSTDTYRRGRDAEDAEDAVSLGGDDDDVQSYVYQSRAQDDTAKGTKPASQQSIRDPQRTHSANSQKNPQSRGSRQPSPQRSHNLSSKITHALPPKPVVSSVPYLHPSHPSIIEATAMSSGRSDRDKKLNGVPSKPISSSDGSTSLPPDWEIRYPRSGARGPYYYNTRTHESTWSLPGDVNKHNLTKDSEPVRPQTSESRSAGGSNLDAASELVVTTRPTQSDAGLQHSPSALTYEDRHYRPADAPKARQDEDRSNNYHSGPHSRSSPPSQEHMAPPKADRGRPPLQRNREEDSSRRGPSPRPASRNRFSDVSQATQHDRWVPSSVSFENSSRRRPTTPPDIQLAEKELAPAVSVFEGPRNDAYSSSPHSTLSASPLSTPFAGHCNSSRGGGCIVSKRLAKPRELSCAASHSLLCSASSANRLMDAHGFLCSPPFLLSLPFASCIHRLFISPFSISSSRTQVSAAPAHISLILYDTSCTSVCYIGYIIARRFRDEKSF
jgi:hypothetical protein